nr:MAG TPA: hypothetical protein [Bacteriophage sp.]
MIIMGQIKANLHISSHTMPSSHRLLKSLVTRPHIF